MINGTEEAKSNLKFINYYVNNVEFYNNELFEEGTIEIDMKMNKDIKYLDDDENTVLVTVNAKIFEGAEKNNYPFTMNISITGIFQIEDITDEHSKELAEVNSIAILFPYLRSLVSTYTANANVPPLILPPINVLKLVGDE